MWWESIPREEWLYYMASPENATQRYLYRTRLDGKGTPERLTPANLPGTHSYNVSPDLRWAIHTYSTFDTPPVTDLVRLSDQKVQWTLEENAKLRATAKDLVSGPTEFFRVDIGDGIVLDGWLIKPKAFDPAKKYPTLVYVYGEPAAQTVVDRWDDWNGVFHRALAQDGYIVVSFDNRGTPASERTRLAQGHLRKRRRTCLPRSRLWLSKLLNVLIPTSIPIVSRCGDAAAEAPTP